MAQVFFGESINVFQTFLQKEALRQEALRQEALRQEALWQKALWQRMAQVIFWEKFNIFGSKGRGSSFTASL